MGTLGTDMGKKENDAVTVNIYLAVWMCKELPCTIALAITENLQLGT